MRFSTRVGITKGPGDDWFDPVLSEDSPLYIDPFLVFDDPDPLFADSHEKVVQFFTVCRDQVWQDAGRHSTGYWDKALGLLTFPEPKEFALGLAMGSPIGAGTSRYFADQMARALEAICNAVDEGIDYVEVLAVFVPGLGIDRISDALCNILKNSFIQYTQQVCARHSITCETMTVRNASWSAANARWSSRRISLPRSPVTNGAVLLAPDRFLQDAPQRITASRFYSWLEGAALNQELRRDLNFDLASELTKAERVKLARKAAYKRPDVVLKYVHEVADETQAEPYDVDGDPRGLINWYEEGREAAHSEAALPEPSQPEFFEWLGTLIDRFRHAVENSDLWRALWNDDLTKPRIEKIVQAIAGSMWTEMCKSANIDISKEASAGRGPVDFKFSAGWARRALVEVKLLSSSKLRKGAAAQLPQYMVSEQLTCAYYVCVGFTDDDLSSERIQLVEDTCHAYEDQSGYVVKPRFVDARPKPAASKL